MQRSRSRRNHPTNREKNADEWSFGSIAARNPMNTRRRRTQEDQALREISSMSITLCDTLLRRYLSKLNVAGRLWSLINMSRRT